MTRVYIAFFAAISCFAADIAESPLLSVKRVHVEKLNGESSAQIRDMIINALQSSRLFLVTEDPDKADAVLRGSAEDLIYTENFQAGEQVSARAGVGSSTTGGRRLPGMNVGVGLDETVRTTERKHEATAAVRLVTREGDVIWSTTQESTGAKFRGASADVADRVVRQLLTDLDKARRPEQVRPAQ